MWTAVILFLFTTKNWCCKLESLRLVWRHSTFATGDTSRTKWLRKAWLVTTIWLVPTRGIFTCWISGVVSWMWCTASFAAFGSRSFTPPNMCTFFSGFWFNLLRCVPDFLISLLALVMLLIVLIFSENLSLKSLFIFLAKSWCMCWRPDSDQHTVTCSPDGNLVKSFTQVDFWCVLLNPCIGFRLSDFFFATIHNNGVIVREKTSRYPTLEGFINH